MPEMRQLPDGTWLNQETGIVVAPEEFAYTAGQNDVYTGPPLIPPNFSNPTPPLPAGRGGAMAPAPNPMAPGTFSRFPAPQLSPNPFGLGEISENVKKVLLVAGIVGITWVTVSFKNKINGKKK